MWDQAFSLLGCKTIGFPQVLNQTEQSIGNKIPYKLEFPLYPKEINQSPIFPNFEAVLKSGQNILLFFN